MVEHHLAKVDVEGSIPFSRSILSNEHTNYRVQRLHRSEYGRSLERA